MEIMKLYQLIRTITLASGDKIREHAAFIEGPAGMKPPEDEIVIVQKRYPIGSKITYELKDAVFENMNQATHRIQRETGSVPPKYYVMVPFRNTQIPVHENRMPLLTSLYGTKEKALEQLSLMFYQMSEEDIRKTFIVSSNDTFLKWLQNKTAQKNQTAC